MILNNAKHTTLSKKMVQVLIHHNQDKITWFTIFSTGGLISIPHSLLQAKEKKKTQIFLQFTLVSCCWW